MVRKSMGKLLVAMDFNWRLVLFVLMPLFLFLILLYSFSLSNANNPFFLSLKRNPSWNPKGAQNHPPPVPREKSEKMSEKEEKKKREIGRIAICLVGGARRFELTGPSLLQRVIGVYRENSDIFVHAPLDKNSYKLSFLRRAPHIAGVRIFEPQPIPETIEQAQVLTSNGSPNGIQGLLQYFNLVEGCLTMIDKHQLESGFRYDWVVRTRLDSFWSAPLSPSHFLSRKYVVPIGSQFGGLNDRLGIGDLDTSRTALSRLSLIPTLYEAGLRTLNSESAFKAQFLTKNMSFVMHTLPFCIISDRRYSFPPARYGVPVAAIGSKRPLSGAKCRPCKPVCKGPCVGDILGNLERGWSWTEWEGGGLELCDASGAWEEGWEEVFDKVAGKSLAKARKKIKGLTVESCVADFEAMRRKAADWDSPSVERICRMGLE
ncbi:hypothetical protein AMTRI_Chr09g35490 [Amborella trichopoda]|uniref:DUF7796 domain-containing protein n=1 Tax=Amborella trichopoda TaxID=13333 RepID=W1NUH3_AMBTC|nr:uncharacterized protein LOC18427001 [Amborella trichopoda]ERM98973.1 hypothetical protein AMTR_s00366p00011950 [Amborella trichopoda]|eukprot:XP_020518443.1 uncharacterized protein LOC18427001 [Amborella trichopoda]